MGEGWTETTNIEFCALTMKVILKKKCNKISNLPIIHVILLYNVKSNEF